MPKIYLKSVRINAGYTQQEWAKKLGVSKDTVLNWENGKTEPTISQIRTMSELSGIPMDFIFVPDKFNVNELEG